MAAGAACTDIPTRASSGRLKMILMRASTSLRRLTTHECIDPGAEHKKTIYSTVIYFAQRMCAEYEACRAENAASRKPCAVKLINRSTARRFVAEKR